MALLDVGTICLSSSREATKYADDLPHMKHFYAILYPVKLFLYKSKEDIFLKNQLSENTQQKYSLFTHIS